SEIGRVAGYQARVVGVCGGGTDRQFAGDRLDIGGDDDAGVEDGSHSAVLTRLATGCAPSDRSDRGREPTRGRPCRRRGPRRRRMSATCGAVDGHEACARASRDGDRHLAACLHPADQFGGVLPQFTQPTVSAAVSMTTIVAHVLRLERLSWPFADSWRERGCMAELDGVTIGITAERRSGEFIDALERRGATVWHGPTLHIVPLADDDRLRAATDEVIDRGVDLVAITTGAGFRG